MRILVDWLAEMTEVPEARELGNRLTDIGLEVEEVVTPSEQIEGLVTAEVVEAMRMKDNPRLTECKLDAGDRQGTVITAAPGVRPGQHYVWAPPGSTLPSGPVDSREFGGHTSEGMLCSSRELGLTRQAHTLLDLPDSSEPGADVVPILDLDQPILELDLTPNRSDCLSHLGVARDYAASMRQDLHDPRPDDLADEGKPGSLGVTIEAPEDCAGYYGLEIDGLTGDIQTPVRARNRLLRMGLRPLHPVVDLTNYVMFELGHPLHPFDAEQLQGDIVVRHARDEETFVGLDEEEYELKTSDLVIADETAPRALAGIMGGAGSGMEPSTDTVFLEAAHFEPTRIRRTARSLELNTEASHRFERGVDPEGMEPALARVVDLFRDWYESDSDGITVHRPVREQTGEFSDKRIEFDPESIYSTLGFSVDESTARDQLERLGIGVKEQQEVWELTVPSWRHDLTRFADILEEIVRLQGYEQIPVEYPEISLERTSPPESDPYRTLGRSLEAQGFQEVITFSFVGEHRHRFVESEPSLRLKNPLSRNQATLRQSLLDSLLRVLEKNVSRSEPILRFYERGRVFPDTDHEPVHLAWVETGRAHRLRWDETSRELDYYDVKGQCEALLEQAGCLDYSFVETDRPGMVEGQTARVISEDQEILGYLGQLETEADFENGVFGAELFVQRLPLEEKTSYSPFSEQPAVNRDLDLVVPEDQTVGPIVEQLQQGEWVESVVVFDIYHGDPLEENEKSVSVNLRFRHPERTLKDDEINQVQKHLVDQSEDEFSARLREE